MDQQPAEMLIPLSDRVAWTRALEGVPHAFAHTWESCAAMHLTTGHASHLYCFADGGVRVVCPVAERGDHGLVDVYTPYGFSGFAGNSPAPRTASHWKAFAADRGFVCGYFGLHPLFFDRSYADAEDYTKVNSLFVLDLTLPTETLFQRLSDNRKRAVRPRGWTLLDDQTQLAVFFRETYPVFMRSRNAGAVYDLSLDTIDALSAAGNVFFLGAGTAEQVQAACMFAHTPSAGEYLFGVSRPGSERFTAALLWHGALRLKAMAVPEFNLGGGVRPGDGVAQFKSRFGARELEFGVLKQVYRPGPFVELCRAGGHDPQDRTGYFPPYRTPRHDPARGPAAHSTSG